MCINTRSTKKFRTFRAIFGCQGFFFWFALTKIINFHNFMHSCDFKSLMGFNTKFTKSFITIKTIMRRNRFSLIFTIANGKIYNFNFDYFVQNRRNNFGIMTFWIIDYWIIDYYLQMHLWDISNHPSLMHSLTR